jgi:hypothetical protein
MVVTVSVSAELFWSEKLQAVINPFWMLPKSIVRVAGSGPVHPTTTDKFGAATDVAISAIAKLFT